MSKLIKLLICCVIIGLSEESDCPLHDTFLSHAGNSVIYTRQHNGTITTKSITCPKNKVFSAIKFRCVEVNKSDVKCTKNGRTLDSSSASCSAYLICTQLEDGSYTAERLQCPNGTVFSPNMSRCVFSNDYVCPKSNNISRTSECKGNGRFSDPNSFNCSSYLTCTQLKEGTYTSNQVICPTGTVFSSNSSRCVSELIYMCPTNENYSHNGIKKNECLANGRFPDPNSKNCSTYLVCTKLDDGSFFSQRVNCPSSTIFSPNENRCISSTDFICPSTDRRTHLPAGGCHANGRFPDSSSKNCSSYIICTQLKNGRFSSNVVSCPAEMVFSMIINRCVSSSSYICMNNKTYENYQSDSGGCHKNGRFPDSHSKTCSSYIICTQSENGSFSSAKVTCPSGTIFSSNVSRCISSPNNICTKNKCIADGRFPDPSSLNCSSYLTCSRKEDGIFSLKREICPPDTLFSPNISACISNTNYICPTNKNGIHVNQNSIGCHASGRFPDPTSTSCTSYKICTKQDDGSYSSNRVMCPTGTIFSPDTSRCVAISSFRCPDVTDVAYCHRNGRFPDPKSSNCSSYVICTKLDDDRYISRRITCPPGSVFSPSVNRCILSSSLCPKE